MLSRKSAAIGIGAAAVAVGLILLVAQAAGGAQLFGVGGVSPQGTTGPQGTRAGTGTQTVCPLVQTGRWVPNYQCGCYWTGVESANGTQAASCPSWCLQDRCCAPCWPVKCMEACPLLPP